MKKIFLKFAFPLTMGILLLIFTMAAGCDEEDIAGPTKHCTDATYPLWCPDAKVCCPRGHAHYCDGSCYATGCPSGTVYMDDCTVE
jgi:hypothetical protein